MKMNRANRHILSLILAVAMLLFLSSCGKKECYPDPNIDDSGQTYTNQEISKSFYANTSGWINTGAFIKSTSYPLQIAASGNISLCPDTPCATPCADNASLCCYPISANKSGWTQIDEKIYPGDNLSFWVDPPQTGSPTSIPTSSAGSAGLNRWTYFNTYTPSSGNCPKTIPFSYDQLSTKCSDLSQGYSVCPLVPSNPGDFSLNSIIGSPGFKCWLVSAAGLQLKFVTDPSGDCSSSGDMTWFNTVFTSSDYNSSTSKDTIIVTPQPLSGCDPNNPATKAKCSVAYAGHDCNTDNPNNCLNRQTFRTLVPNKYVGKLCAGLPSSGPSGVGGYTLKFKRNACQAIDGNPSPSASYTGINNLGALEYVVMEGTPDDKTTGTIISKSANISSGPEGNLYLRIVVNPQSYKNNTGQYDVKINYKEYTVPQGISCIIEKLRTQLRALTLNTLPQYFFNMSCVGSGCDCADGNCENPYIKFIRAVLVLYIVAYGFAFLIGYVKISQKDLVIRILKIAIVLALISKNSWQFFHDYFFDLFICGMDDLIRLAQIQQDPSGNVFGFLDRVLNLMLFTKSTWLKFLALLTTSPMGFILGIMVIISVILFLVGIFKAIVTYLMAIFAIGFLIMLAPIFIPCILFQMTRKLFDNWINMFVKYSLEPVMLVIGLSVLVDLLYNVFIQMINFSVCWKCVLPINLDFPIASDFVKAIGASDTLFCFEFFGVFGFFSDGGGAILSSLGVDIVNTLFFIILAMLIKGYDDLVQSMIVRIVGQRKQTFKASEGRSTGDIGQAILARTGYTGLEHGAYQVAKAKARDLIFGKEQKGLEQGRGASQPPGTTPPVSNQPPTITQGAALISGMNSVIDSHQDLATATNPATDDFTRTKATENIIKSMHDNLHMTPDYQAFMAGSHAFLINPLPANIAQMPEAQAFHAALSNDAPTQQALKDLSDPTTSTPAARDQFASAVANNPALSQVFTDSTARTALVNQMMVARGGVGTPPAATPPAPQGSTTAQNRGVGP